MKKLTARQKKLLREHYKKAVEIRKMASKLYGDDECWLRDMLADLMHLQKDFEAELEVARGHYQAEINREDYKMSDKFEIPVGDEQEGDQSSTPKWYAKTSAGGHQGLVIDESTGRTVAVTYDPKDAVKVAAVNDLLEAAGDALACLENLRSIQQWDKKDGDEIDEAVDAKTKLQAAIRKAERGE